MTTVALALGIVLEAIEILRRAPAWLLVLAGLLVYSVILLVILYRWWILAGLVALLAFRLAGRRIARQRT